ncbi:MULTISPECIES: hypothetical protein [unclassified Streptomyces]|uniref:hypothetical protein n=1 Tax=unclassified Streptomyces TaxID=2593676 RepID=UPI0033201A80
MRPADRTQGQRDHHDNPPPTPGGRSRRAFGGAGPWAAVLGCLVLACTACAGAGGEAAAIQQAELVGDWGNADGARVHVSADHDFSASGINHAVPDYECSTTMTGTWRFWVQDGSPSDFTASDPATEGESFLVSRPAESATDRCSFQGRVQRDDEGFSICLVLDLDQSCTTDELLRKESARPR